MDKSTIYDQYQKVHFEIVF